MPIFTNNTTFPFYKFRKFDDANISSLEDIKANIFIPKKQNFRKDLIDVINNQERQHLFEILMDRILLMIYNDSFEKISVKEIESSSIENKNNFILLLNYRIDLKKINKELEYLEDNNVKVNSEKLIHDLILFTYKFFYIELSRMIYCQLFDDFKVTMDFEKYYKTYSKYKNNIENGKYNESNYIQQKEFIENFNKSFKTNNINEIKTTIDELLLYSNKKKSIYHLNKIIEDNIIIEQTLSSTKKNKILIPFYKLIMCELFYKQNRDLDINDSLLIESFKKFRQLMKK